MKRETRELIALLQVRLEGLIQDKHSLRIVCDSIEDLAKLAFIDGSKEATTRALEMIEGEIRNE